MTITKDIERKRTEYQRRFFSFGVSLRSLKWKSEESMKLRHHELLRDLNIEGKSILDVGCGFGNILPRLKEKASRFRYTGVDIVPEFIKVAKEQYAQYRFVVRDYVEHPLAEHFDLVLCSGVLNSNFESALSYRRKAIAVMFAHAKEALAFNMAGDYPQPPNTADRTIYYADSLEMLRYCVSLTPRIIFRSQYCPKDFTIILFKEKPRRATSRRSWSGRGSKQAG
jgi:SAM-dependent methyltransferase